MKKAKQAGFVRMFHQVSELMESNLEKWKTVPEIRKTYDVFVKHLKKFMDLQPDLEMDLKPLKKEWKQQRKNLVDKTFPVGNILLVYTADHSIKPDPAFGISRKQMSGFKNKELLKMAALIHKKAVKYFESGLVSYGLSNSMLLELDDILKLCESAFKMRSDMLLNQKKTVKESRVQFKAVIKILDDRMDKLMTVFSGTHPSYYQAYLGARKIQDAAKP